MGVVYMLASENDHYIGSTIYKLNKRISQHKSQYKRWLNEKTTYCNSYEIIKNEKYEVIIIEEVEKETKEACREREQLWINFYGKENLINNRNVIRLDIEKLKENRKEVDKKYYENNKEKIKEYYKEYYQKNKKLNI